jgi:hypothetical protein
VWAALFGEPLCTVHVNAPGAVVIAVVAEELRREYRRVLVALDGRSVRAKLLWPVVLSVVGMVVGGEGFSSPVMTAQVVEEGPAGTKTQITVRGGRPAKMRFGVPGALNRAASRLAQQGAVVTATPWDRYPYLRKGRAPGR